MRFFHGQIQSNNGGVFHSWGISVRLNFYIVIYFFLNLQFEHILVIFLFAEAILYLIFSILEKKIFYLVYPDFKSTCCLDSSLESFSAGNEHHKTKLIEDLVLYPKKFFFFFLTFLIVFLPSSY